MPAVRPMRASWTIWTFATLSLCSAVVECRAAELYVGVRNNPNAGCFGSPSDLTGDDEWPAILAV
jgi:hypothetical protein